MSSNLAKKFKSMNIGNVFDVDYMKNTWDDFSLVPVKKIVVNPPEHKYISVDVPSADGELDLSEALTIQPMYKNRTGSWHFRMYDNKKTCLTKYSDILSFLHGRKKYMILDEEPNYYYEGRFNVASMQYQSHGNWADIVISYNLHPYKYDIYSSLEAWKWDPFNFENGVIRDYSNIIVRDGEVITLNLVGSRKPISPTFTATGNGVVITFKGETYNLETYMEETVFAGIVLDEGDNELQLELRVGDEAIVNIGYRGAYL